jgi:hypothetical protein
MVNIFKWRLSYQEQANFQANLADLKSYGKKNWLKGIGFTFLVQASQEYFTNHIFGCTLSAGLLLGYAVYDRNKQCKQAESAKDEVQEQRYFIELVVVTLGCGLMIFLATQTMPLSFRSWLHLQ